MVYATSPKILYPNLIKEMTNNLKKFTLSEPLWVAKGWSNNSGP
jgi:hypothetical protein